MFGKNFKSARDTVVNVSEPKIVESREGPRLMGVNKEKLYDSFVMGLDRANAKVVAIQDEITRLHGELDASLVAVAALQSAINTVDADANNPAKAQSTVNLDTLTRHLNEMKLQLTN